MRKEPARRTLALQESKVPYKVKFLHDHNRMFIGVINRHNRRMFAKLSRLGKLQNTHVPFFFLHHTGQVQ